MSFSKLHKYIKNRITKQIKKTDYNTEQTKQRAYRGRNSFLKESHLGILDLTIDMQSSTSIDCFLKILSFLSFYTDHKNIKRDELVNNYPTAKEKWKPPSFNQTWKGPQKHHKTPELARNSSTKNKRAYNVRKGHLPFPQTSHKTHTNLGWHPITYLSS